MAGKQYSMEFLLSAQLNGGFSSTFSKAQEEFARLGKEIQSVQRLQSDIASYQKQQAAVDNTAAKLQNLQQQHDLLQKEISETSGSTAALEREKLKLEQRISNTVSTLEKQQQKLEATSSRLKENGVDTADLAKKEAELAEKIKQLSAEQEKAAATMEEYADSASSGFEAVSSAIAAAGIAEALKEIAEAYMECISIAGGFEAGMSNVAALSGATAAEMEALTEKAKELGADTKFSAQEAAEAMGYMAMAGWEASEMLAGMDGVLQLAAASGEDLAMVSDIVTDSMTAFGLTAADTARYADVLAAAATKSNTSVAYMGETFKYAAPIAGALGYSVEDVSVAVGLMANAGIKGSLAGTALRNVFNGLLEGATLTSAAFGEYEYSAVKADGTMRSFSETIADLRYYFDQMTAAEKVANAETIAGMHGYSGLLAILNSTDEEYASLTASINDCTGAAQRMAAVKMDNLNGELELMNGAWEALKTTIGEQFIPEMRTLYGVGADVFGAIDKFVQENPAVVKGVTAFVGVLGAAVTGLAAVSAATKVAIPLLKLLGASIPGVNIALGVAAVVGGVVALTNNLSAEEREMYQLTATTRDHYDELQALRGEYEKVCEVYGETSEEALRLRYELDDLEESYETNRQTIEEFAAECDALVEAHDALVAEYEESTRAAHDNEISTLALIQRLSDLATSTDQSASAQDEMKAIIAELNQTVDGLNLSYEDLIANQGDALTSLTAMAQAQAEQERYQEQYQTYVELLKEESLLKEQLGDATSEVTAAQERYNEASSALRQSWKGSNGKLSGWNMFWSWTTEEQRANDAAVDALHEAQAEQEELQAAYDENLALQEDIRAAWGDLSAEGEDGSAILVSSIDRVMAQMASLSEAYSAAYEAAYTSISGQYALWDEAADVVATSAGSINSALESQVTYWQDYNANLQTLTERSADIAGLSDMIASFADGSAESVNAIAGMAAASDEDLAAMVANWQALQEEQQNASISIAELASGFGSAMDELQTELAEDIEAMDLSEEAAASGQATIQSYIDGALGLLPQVESAYAQLAKAALDALTPASGGVGVNITDYSGRAAFSIPGYAAGTRSAVPGFALVGERGPELVYFGGGEQVMTAQETAALMQDRRIAALEEPYQIAMLAPEMLAAMNSYAEITAVQAKIAARPMEALIGNAETAPAAPSSIQVVFQIEGNATPETVAALRDYGEEFVERVIEIVEEHVLDAARKSYR